MAYDTNAITLAELAMVSKDPVMQKMVMAIYDTKCILKDIPLQTKQALRVRGNRTLGSNLTGLNAGWRPLGELPSFSKSKGEPWEEQLYVLGTRFQVEERELKDLDFYQDPIGYQIKNWIAAMEYDFNDKFFNNTPQLNVNAPVGLKYRTDNPLDSAVATEIKMNGGAVDVYPATVTAASANLFLTLIQAGLDYLPPGRKVMYMNDEMMRAFTAAVRIMGAGSGFKTNAEKAPFEEEIPTYQGARLRDCGRKVDQITRNIVPYETAAGAVGTAGVDNRTSIYFVSYGEDSFAGWQDGELTTKDLGLDPTNGLQHNYLIDYGIGLVQPHPRGVLRLYNVKVRA